VKPAALVVVLVLVLVLGFALEDENEDDDEDDVSPGGKPASPLLRSPIIREVLA
jgi:hypothetical protein